jgi:hypothetical protein
MRYDYVSIINVARMEKSAAAAGIQEYSSTSNIEIDARAGCHPKMLGWLVVFWFMYLVPCWVPARYQLKLASHPTLTQAVATTVLFGTGDVLAQQFVEKKGLQDYELARTGRMAFYGGGMLLKLTIHPNSIPILN